jgi:hypothetical protein
MVLEEEEDVLWICRSSTRHSFRDRDRDRDRMWVLLARVDMFTTTTTARLVGFESLSEIGTRVESVCLIPAGDLIIARK